MNKQPIFIAAIAACLCACGGKQSADTDTYTSGTIAIAADECFAPIIDSEIFVFESAYPEATLLPRYGGESETVDLLLQDSVRFAVLSRTLTTAEKKQLKDEHQLYAREIKIAIDAVALIVNPQNPDSLISLSQFRQILNGEVKTWRELNPTSSLGDVNVVFDNPHSGTVRYAIDSLLNGRKIAAKVYAQPTNAEVIDYVSRTPDALGVIGVNWIGDRADSTQMTFNDRVRVLAVSNYATPAPENSFKPFQYYLYQKEYPMTREVYIILTDPRMGLATGFSTFVAGDKGQRIILKSGLLPAILNQVRFVNVKEN